MILDDHDDKASDFMDCLIHLMESIKAKEEEKPIPVPRNQRLIKGNKMTTLHPEGYEIPQCCSQVNESEGRVRQVRPLRLWDASE